MKDVRRGNADHVHPGVGDQSVPVAGRSGEAKITGSRRGSIGSHIGQQLERGLDRQAEYGARRAVSQSVRLAHEARADESDAKRFHSEPYYPLPLSTPPTRLA